MPSSQDPERRSLLGDEALVTKRGAAATPLPKFQLAVIFAIKLTVPVAVQQTGPYINEFLARVLSRPSNQIGYFSGLLSFASSIPHIASTYPWGRISDRVGRRPPIFFSMLLLALGTLFFGLSSTFGEIVAIRAITGLSLGVVGVLHSVVGELTDESNSSTAFPLYDTVAAVGFVIGPLIGGLLVHPAETWPSLFQNQFWIEHPYFLPCLVTGFYAFVTSTISVTVLKETNPPSARRSASNGGYEPVADVEYHSEVRKPPGARELLSYPMIRYISASSGAIGITAAAFNVFFTLLAYTDLVDGGLQLEPAKIGYALSMMGFISIPLKLSLPFILTRWSTLTIFRLSLRAWPVTFAALPLLSILARSTGLDRTPAQSTVLWVAISFVLFLSRVGCMSFGLVMLLVKEYVPDTAALGAANGLTELTQMLGILVGPPIINSLFAYSVTNNILGGYLWAVVIIALSIGLARIGDVMIKHEAAVARAGRERLD